MLLAVLVWPTRAFDPRVVLVALLVILVVEAAAQGRLVALGLSLAVLAVAVVLLASLWTGLVSSWRIVLAVLLVAAGLVPLVLNVQEVRRT